MEGIPCFQKSDGSLISKLDCDMTNLTLKPSCDILQVSRCQGGGGTKVHLAVTHTRPGIVYSTGNGCQHVKTPNS